MYICRSSSSAECSKMRFAFTFSSRVAITVTSLRLRAHLKKLYAFGENNLAIHALSGKESDLTVSGIELVQTLDGTTHAIVTITKWQSTLGQTFYMKDMRKLDDQLRRTEEQMQIPQQSTFYDVASQVQPKAKSQPLAQAHATGPVNISVAP